MSHKATNWLSDLTGLSASEFRVLFHLCDCHNPSKGCFPQQSYLLEKAEVSNGTLNNALNALEVKGLIRRVLRSDPETKKRISTLYVLGCDENLSPKTGDGANSKKQAEPSPTFEQSHLQPTGDKPVKGTCKGTSNGDFEPSLFSEDEKRQPKGKPSINIEEKFKEFYRAYPRKVGPEAARKNFARAVKGGADPDEIIAGAERYAADVRAKGTDRQFIKHPQGWISENRWKDEIDAPPPSQAPVARWYEDQIER